MRSRKIRLWCGNALVRPGPYTAEEFIGLLKRRSQQESGAFISRGVEPAPAGRNLKVATTSLTEYLLRFYPFLHIFGRNLLYYFFIFQRRTNNVLIEEDTDAKIKTHRGAAKRLKMTGTGKIKRYSGYEEPSPHRKVGEKDAEAQNSFFSFQGRLW